MSSDSLGDFPRPALAADILAVSRTAGRLRVLLIRRRIDPFAGMWALPGGFVEAGEQIVEAARRELIEETGLVVGEIELLGVYDTPERDPRGWVVSVVHVAWDVEEVAVTAGDDAAQACWFDLDDLPALAFDHVNALEDLRAMAARLA